MASADQIRLLLVEDVPQVAQYVRGLLNAQSQVRLVDIVADGTQVPTRISEHRPDVVVVDALLQGRLRGMQLVKQLHDLRIGVPVIVLTVPQNPVQVDAEKGIDEVLSMPFNGYDLITRIAGVHKSAAAATEKGPSKLIVVFAPKGGVGKTTMAFNLGVAASGLGLRTALVDGSIQFGDLRGLLRAPRDAPSMLDLPTDRISESDLQEVLWRGPADVDILLAPPRIEMAEMVLVRDVEKTLSLMRRLYDLVIVDTGVGLDELTLALLDQADTILEVVTYDATTIRNTIAMAETFQKIGYPPSKVQYLVNRADASAGIDPTDLRRALGREPEYSIRSDGPTVGPASNQGAPFVTAEPGSGVSKDVIEVARSLFGIAGAAGSKAAAKSGANAALAGAR
ncbi:MAG TPA: response regulator [Candidatus Limnocylindrales bacterium]|nr:response regulator [Candidatus Limnocylindrales bacterium]